MKSWKRYLIEFFVIVFSILGAFSLEAWYAEYLEDQIAKEYIQLLVEDLNKSQNEFRQVQSYNNDAEEAIVKLLDQPFSDSIYTWLREVSYLNNPVPIIGAGEALISSGNLDILEDRKLRFIITDWMSRIKDFWIEPLYNMEKTDRDLFRDLSQYYDSRILIEKNYTPTSEPKLDKAEKILINLLLNKQKMKGYRKNMIEKNQYLLDALQNHIE